jgi:hypothetical protein
VAGKYEYAPPQLSLLTAARVRVQLPDAANTLDCRLEKTDQQWLFSYQPASQTEVDLNNGAAVRQIVIMAISRSGQQSLPASIQF